MAIYNLLSREGLGACPPPRKTLAIRLLDIDFDAIWEVQVTNLGASTITSLSGCAVNVNVHVLY